MIDFSFLVQWKKSVSGLRGTILTLKLQFPTQSGGKFGHYNSCLRAKVIGTWTPGILFLKFKFLTFKFQPNK